MNKAKVGTDNICFEMESKKETEARTYDEVAGKIKTPSTKRIETFAQEAEKKDQPLKEPDKVVFRRMPLIAAAVVAVAFLTAVASLVLALTMMMPRNDLTMEQDYFLELK